MKLFKDKYFYMIVVLWVISILLVNPFGNFPFSDDFSYAYPIKRYLETGILRITDWSSMTLVAHLWIGITVSKIFGFSFDVLRFVSIVAGLIGGVISYAFLKSLKIDTKISFVSSLLIIFNPYFFFHAFCFDTDILFYTIFVLSMVCYFHFYRTEKNYLIILAVLINIFAFLIRDLALILPVAFAIGYFYQKGFNKKTILTSLISIFLLFCAYYLHRYWITNIHGLPKSMDFSKNKMLGIIYSGPVHLIFILSKNIYYFLLFHGTFLLPVSLYLYLTDLPIKKKHLKYAIGSITILAISTVCMIKFIPKAHNTIQYLLFSNIYFHNFAIDDLYSPSTKYIFIFSELWINIVAIIGIISGMFLLYVAAINFWNSYKNKKSGLSKKNGAFVFLFLIIFFYYIPILTQVPMTRYYLPTLLAVLILFFRNSDVMKPLNRLRKWVLSAVTLLIIYFSIAGAHDMMEYNRAKLKALSYLTKGINIPNNLIDGGFEFNAWYFYNYDYKDLKYKNWWWVQDDQYKVVWGKCAAYNTLKEYDYYRWLPPGFHSKMYVLKRKNVSK